MNSLKIDTGIDWLGEVPHEWARCRLKTTIKESFNGVWGDEPKDNENDLICIRVADFNYNKLTINLNKYTVRNIPKNQHNRMLKKGDILIEKSGGGEKQPVGRAIIYDNEIGKAVCSNFIGKITLYKAKVIPKFVAYYLSSLYSKGINTKHIKQTTGIQNLDLESYLNESIYLPLLTEQKKIADFLDQKCALIDALIEKKQKLVELKKEERTALINQAVTKGLDPKVPMKDSGIEWLGEIPEHWKVKRLKYVSMVQPSNVDKKSNEGELSVLLCNYVDVYMNEIIDNSITFMKATANNNEIEKFKLIIDDVLITKDSETPDDIAVPALVKIEKDNLLCGYHLAQIRSNKSDLNGEFLFRLFQSKLFNQYFEVEANGITRFGLGVDSIKNVVITLPPVPEQIAIATHIHRETGRVDAIIEKIQKQIELLKEYKTTLISEAVTGKIIPA